MLLLDRGAIAQLLRAAGVPSQDAPGPRQSLLGDELPPEQSPTYGPMRGAMPVRRASAGVMPDETQGVPMSLLAGAAPQSAPPAPRPSFGRRVAEGIRGLLGGNEMPAGYEGLFTPEDLNRVKSSVPRALFNLLGGHTEGEVQKERLQELYATRQATQLKAREQAVFERFAPDGTEDSDALNLKLRRLHAALAAIGSPRADKLGDVIDNIQPPKVVAQPVRNIDPLSPEGIDARLLFEERKPKPDHELTPYQRESLRLQELRLRASLAGTRAPRAPTEAQEKSHIYYNLMANSAPEIDALIAAGNVRPDMITLALRSGVLDFATNRLLNADEQKLIRAARDFTAGVLRKESGAAIKNDEILNTFQRMIPLSGEGPEVTERKRIARNAYMKTMERSAIPATNYYRVLEAGGVPQDDVENPNATGILPSPPNPARKAAAKTGSDFIKSLRKRATP